MNIIFETNNIVCDGNITPDSINTDETKRST
jgi:hypothetical protein